MVPRRIGATLLGESVSKLGDWLVNRIAGASVGGQLRKSVAQLRKELRVQDLEHQLTQAQVGLAKLRIDMLEQGYGTPVCTAGDYTLLEYRLVSPDFSEPLAGAEAELDDNRLIVTGPTFRVAIESEDEEELVAMRDEINCRAASGKTAADAIPAQCEELEALREMEVEKAATLEYTREELDLAERQLERLRQVRK